MSYSAVIGAVRGVLLFAAGAAAAAAWTGGLYASLALAVLLALWIMALAVDRRGTAPAPDPPGPRPEQAERRRLTAYLDLSPAPLVTIDRRDRVKAVNRAARRLFGAEALIADADETLARAIAMTEPGLSRTVVLNTGAGSRSFALVTEDIAVDADANRVAALVGIDGELRAAQADALREMLQVLGHELRNTLTPIVSLGRTALDLLAAPAPDLADVEDAVGTIARRAGALQRFSESYATLARLPPPDRRRVDVNAMLTDLGRLFTTRWPTVTLHRPEDARTIGANIDADQVAAALWALLQNAAEAVLAVREPTVKLSALARPGELSFRISDNGPGIARADRDAVFRPFFTTKPDGDGIGLALARQVFLGHGGTLDAQDGSGTGVCFVATISVRPFPVDQASAASSAG